MVKSWFGLYYFAISKYGRIKSAQMLIKAWLKPYVHTNAVKDLTKIFLCFLGFFEVPTAEFADQQAIVVFDKLGKNIMKGNGPPAWRHMRISLAEGQLVGLGFFVVINRVAEVVVDMAMSDEWCDASYLVYHIQVVKT